MKAELLPRSKARNAYELLAEVIQAITDEPKRYNQQAWLATEPDLDDAPNGFPACETVGCRAGWLVLLADGPRNYEDGVDGRVHRLINRAYELLGSSNHPIPENTPNWGAELDYANAIQALFSFWAIQGTELAGTRGYAAKGAAGIQEFMNTWEMRLKATPIERKA